VPGPDFAGQVGERAAHVLVADVQPEHQPGVRPDLVQPRGTPGHSGALPGDPDQARPLHVGQCQRDRGLGQARQARQVSPRARPELADLAEQELLVQGPDQLRPGGLAAPLTGAHGHANELGVRWLGAGRLGDAGDTR
jgi:hypothetical protein